MKRYSLLSCFKMSHISTRLSICTHHCSTLIFNDCLLVITVILLDRGSIRSLCRHNIVTQCACIVTTSWAQEEQPSTSIHYQEKTTIIKTALKPRQEKDAYHLLDRPGQVVLARLRSGLIRLNAHMHRKLKIVPSPNVSMWWGRQDNRACSLEM